MRSKPLFDGRCGCSCGCKEWITPDERRACKGKCIACYGDFHGLQKRLRAARTEYTPFANDYGDDEP